MDKVTATGSLKQVSMFLSWLLCHLVALDDTSDEDEEEDDEEVESKLLKFYVELS